MAYSNDNLVRVSSTANETAPKIYAYKSTTDAIATIKASGYFNNAMINVVLGLGKLAIGDVMFLQGSDAAELVRITAVTTNVTVEHYVTVTLNMENILTTGNLTGGNLIATSDVSGATGTFSGAVGAGALTLTDVLTFSDGATIDNTGADTLTITETNIDLVGTLAVDVVNASGLLTITSESLDFAGTPTNDVIDFSGITWTPNVGGSGGNCLIRAGTYGAPLTNDSAYQSGMIRLYGRTTDLNTSYDRGVFVCLKTQGSKGIFPVSGLAEVETTASGDGPTSVHACQYIAHLLETGSKVASTATVHGGWFKITAIDGATMPVGVVAAPIWIDNQLYGSNIGSGGTLATEYGIYATTGGSRPHAVIGFNTTSSGYNNFLSFDSTVASQTMLGSADIDAGTADRYLKIDINGTAYGIQLYAI